MSLLDELATVGSQLPPSHVVPPQRVPEILSALVAYVEHGSEMVDAANSGVDPDMNLTRVECLLSPDSPPRDAPTVQPFAPTTGAVTASDVNALAEQMARIERRLESQSAMPHSNGGDDLADANAEIESLRAQLAIAQGNVERDANPVVTEPVPPFSPDESNTDDNRDGS